MKVARVHKFGEPLQIDEIPVPQPKQGQVLIAIIASGVCHTDVHVVAGDMGDKPTLPFIPGHEIVGRIAALGEGVTEHKEGDIIGVPSLFWACGVCEYCKAGWETLCHTQLATGFTVDGGFAEYVVAHTDFVVRIPEGCDPFTMAPILCAGVTTYKGLKQTKAKKGDWVVIIGIGGLGHVALQYAREFGFRTIAIDLDEQKLELARQLGASLIVNAKTEDAATRIQEEIGGAHASLVTATSSAAFRTGVAVLRRGGIAVLNGLPPGEFPLSICDVVLSGLTVHGSIIGTRKDMDEAVELAVRANIQTRIEKCRLEEINDVFARLQRGDILGRVVIDMT